MPQFWACLHREGPGRGRCFPGLDASNFGSLKEALGTPGCVADLIVTGARSLHTPVSLKIRAGSRINAVRLYDALALAAAAFTLCTSAFAFA